MKRLGIEGKMSQPIGPSQPSIGRIVHVELPPITVPAIVTAVTSSDGDIMCTIFPPGQPPRVSSIISHDEARAPSTWHWPPVR